MVLQNLPVVREKDEGKEDKDEEKKEGKKT
jgi:hypothetical protein